MATSMQGATLTKGDQLFCQLAQFLGI
jgi:hypothetical protein